MTLENCKRLLKHYQETGNKEAELDMLANLERRGYDPKKTANNK